MSRSIVAGAVLASLAGGLSGAVGASTAMASGGTGGSGVGVAPSAVTTTPSTTTAPSTTTTTTSSSGGTGVGAPPPTPSTPTHPLVQGPTAVVLDGLAFAPSYAPKAVQDAIWAGDAIRDKPYVWGGGHAAFIASGYDCSGSVSYVLHAAGLLKSPLTSVGFLTWGRRGAGHWITVYAQDGHAFIEIAGIRFDTSSEDDPDPPPGTGPRWRPLYPDPPGFEPRHPAGF